MHFFDLFFIVHRFCAFVRVTVLRNLHGRTYSQTLCPNLFFFFLQPGSVRDPAGLAGTGLCTGPVPGPVWQLRPRSNRDRIRIGYRQEEMDKASKFSFAFQTMQLLSLIYYATLSYIS